jgi:hypothetical protein
MDQSALLTYTDVTAVARLVPILVHDSVAAYDLQGLLLALVVV